MRILVIEDEQKLARNIKRGLQEASHAVDVRHDGEEGLHIAEDEPYDAIILDVMIPKINGWSVLEKLRNKGITTPIILLTGRTAVKDRVDDLGQQVLGHLEAATKA